MSRTWRPKRQGLSVRPACSVWNSGENSKGPAQLAASFYPGPAHSAFPMASSRDGLPQLPSCCLVNTWMVVVAPLLALVPWGQGGGITACMAGDPLCYLSSWMLAWDPRISAGLSAGVSEPPRPVIQLWSLRLARGFAGVG